MAEGQQQEQMDRLRCHLVISRLDKGSTMQRAQLRCGAWEEDQVDPHYELLEAAMSELR